MSRAFVKEDHDEPERSGRRRSLRGLPPGAPNYLTARGAARIRDEIQRLRDAGNLEALDEWEEVLATATIVSPPQGAPNAVSFGATVTLQTADQDTRTYRIVGVDEVTLDESAISWISPLARALLGTSRGDRVALGDGPLKATVTDICFPA